MSKSHLTHYPSKTTVCVSLMVYVCRLQAEFWTGKVARSSEIFLQHTKLHHWSYISLLNLQHILRGLIRDVPICKQITFYKRALVM